MFTNRREAGRLLAEKIKKQIKEAIILGITRGGMVLAVEMASLLDLPVYPIIVKKIGASENSELALGALTFQNTVYLDWDLIRNTGSTKDYIDNEIKIKQQEIEELSQKFNPKKPPLLENKKIIVVDDGVATGATVKVVIKYLKKKKAGKIIIAVPVIARDSYKKLKTQVDNIIALEIPQSFGAVGEFYREFPQVSDEDVIKLLKQ